MAPAQDLFRCATRAILKWAHKQGIEAGIFSALHTHDRQLSQYTQIYFSVTRSGPDALRTILLKKEGLGNHLPMHAYPPAPRQPRSGPAF